MPPANSPAPIGTALLILLLVPMLALALGLVPWIVWQYVKAWRRRGERRLAGDMAWLRAMYPDHEALPTPTRRAPMLPTPRGWTAGQVLIYAAQAGAIGWLTWLITEGAAAKDGGPPQYFLALLLFAALIAFATAVLTAL